MLHYTFPVYALLAAGMAALPQRFISEGATGSSPLQLHLGGGILSSTTAPPTPLETTLTPPASLPPAVDTPLSVQAATLPYPTPSPTPPPTSLDPREATRNNSSTSDDDDGQDTDTAPLQKWPKWLGAATLALVFYDALTLCVFLWLWIAGSLWWLPWFGQAGDDPEERAWEEARWGVELAGLEEGARAARAREVGVEREMRRMGMV